MIDDGAEHATGRLTPPEVIRSLCNHSGLTVRQLSDVVQAEGLPTAVRFAVWKGQQRNRRHLVEGPPPSGRLLRVHVTEVLAASNPPVGGSDVPPPGARAGRHGR